MSLMPPPNAHWHGSARACVSLALHAARGNALHERSRQQYSPVTHSFETDELAHWQSDASGSASLSGHALSGSERHVLSAQQYRPAAQSFTADPFTHLHAAGSSIVLFGVQSISSSHVSASSTTATPRQPLQRSVSVPK